MKTVRLDGVSAGIFRDDNNDGVEMTISGWSKAYRSIQEGEYVLIVSTSGQESRYKVTRMKRPNDVKDQFFMDVKFNPRTNKSYSIL